jgi:hypothetical protein
MLPSHIKIKMVEVKTREFSSQRDLIDLCASVLLGSASRTDIIGPPVGVVAFCCCIHIKKVLLKIFLMSTNSDVFLTTFRAL